MNGRRSKRVSRKEDDSVKDISAEEVQLKSGEFEKLKSQLWWPRELYEDLSLPTASSGELL